MQINEPINQHKKLNIITIADSSDTGDSAVRYGEKLANIFSASLTVVRNFGFSLEERKNHSPITQLHVPGSVVRDDYFFPERIYRFAEDTNTIMFVIGVDYKDKKALFNKKRALRFIKSSRLPVMTIGNTPPPENAFQHVVLPIDIERQSKEKALWASYFSRFYKATIHILYTRYEDEGLQQQVEDNLVFVKKLYQNLEVDYVMEEVEYTADLDFYSVEYAKKKSITLTVVMMMRYFTLADFLLGHSKWKILANTIDLPVLCINQRDDLYVLCT